MYMVALVCMHIVTPTLFIVCRCNQKASSYTCPRCHVRYCSLDCYKKHSAQCTEGFYRCVAGIQTSSTVSKCFVPYHMSYQLKQCSHAACCFQGQYSV